MNNSPESLVIEDSLYRVLGEPAPVSATVGETRITATKETIDDDTEDVPDDDILEL